MKANIIDTQEAPNKWWAQHDRRMRNIANASSYTDAQKTRAERMRMALSEVYHGKVFEPSYGKRGISLKVGNAVILDRKNLRLLEKDWEAQGVIKKDSAQGIIYNIPKA